MISIIFLLLRNHGLNYSVILLLLVDVRVTDLVTVVLQIFKAARINPKCFLKNISKWETNESK